MTRVAQILAGAAPGDAVTGAALETAALLAPLATSVVHARHIDPALSDQVSPLDAYQEGPDPAEDLLVLHHSIGEPFIEEWLASRPERTVLVYHNISPADAFTPWDEGLARLLALGREQLLRYRDRVALALAVSEYNADELRRLGYRHVEVVPLLFDPARLLEVAPAPATAHHLEVLEGPLVLFVGQLLPHKRPDVLVAAHHVLVSHLLPGAQLALVGAGRLPAYRQRLQRWVEMLNLPSVWLAGHVEDAELAAFYRRADVFVTASEHEGFCAPLLEAMAFDVPVVARAVGGVAATVGGAGLVLAPGDGPTVIAEAVARVLTDGALAGRMRAAGRSRLAASTVEKAREETLDRLAPLL